MHCRLFGRTRILVPIVTYRKLQIETFNLKVPSDMRNETPLDRRIHKLEFYEMVLP